MLLRLLGMLRLLMCSGGSVGSLSRRRGRYGSRSGDGCFFLFSKGTRRRRGARDLRFDGI